MPTATERPESPCPLGWMPRPWLLPGSKPCGALLQLGLKMPLQGILIRAKKAPPPPMHRRHGRGDRGRLPQRWRFGGQQARRPHPGAGRTASDVPPLSCWPPELLSPAVSDGTG